MTIGITFNDVNDACVRRNNGGNDTLIVHFLAAQALLLLEILNIKLSIVRVQPICIIVDPSSMNTD